MEEIKRQVARARRRLITEQFLGIFAWSMFISLIVAVIALAIPKVFAVELGGATWTYGWLCGTAVFGLALASVWTYAIRRGELEAAIEIDKRFGLKERVSSTLALLPAELETEAGQALMSDAARRVAKLDVTDQFRIRMDLRPLLPLIPVLAVVAILFLPDASARQADAADSIKAEIAKKVKVSTQTLNEKINALQKKAAENGLEKTELDLKRLGKGLEKLQSDNAVDRKKALVKMSELTNDLEKRRQQLGGADKMRQQLSQLKDLKQGPADKVAQAIKDGEFQKAVTAMQQLQEKMKNGELTEQQQKDLANQLDRMKQKLNDAAAAHEQAKADLQKEIDKKRKQGDLAGAGRLQQKLDQMKAQDQQMQQMQQMAQQMGQAAQKLKQGDQQGAAQQLQQMAQQLQQMQDQMEELETIDDAMNEVANAKNAMNCKQCNGQGCQACQGSMMGMNGMGNQRNGRPGNGMGEGRGRGDRLEEETDTNSYSTRVKGKLRPGEVVNTGEANGPNRAGQTRQSVKDEILGAKREEGDPIVNQRLPRAEREHLQQYFEKFNDAGF